MNIKTNSKEVKNNDTFIALKGFNNDGHDYILEAILNGSNKIIVEKIPKFIEVVPDTKEYLDNYLKDNYSYKFKDLKIIGITGTNGKTTTAYLISNMLTELNINNAYIGTIGFYINSKYIKNLNNTTPDILTTYNLLNEAIENNCKFIIMEVSSHALNLNRLKGINFDIGVFTNLTRDHLDYHKTMDNYLNAKLKITDKIKENGFIIINNDDDYSNYFKKNNYITLGFNNSDYKIINYNNLSDGTDINLEYNNKIYNIKTNLHSKFNVYNYLFAFITLHKLGFNINDIINITSNIYPPRGRMELININNLSIIIDYAHTPDAVLKIIDAVKECYNKKIITIIGCGGNRDKFKRSVMGLAATLNSSYVIFTNDNPRNENEVDIMNDITKDLEKNNYEIIFDRKEAIEKGLSILDNDSILLILGKGHEDYQIINNKKIHFSDKETVINFFK